MQGSDGEGAVWLSTESSLRGFASENFTHALSNNLKNFFLKVNGAEGENTEFYN